MRLIQVYPTLSMNNGEDISFGHVVFQRQSSRCDNMWNVACTNFADLGLSQFGACPFDTSEICSIAESVCSTVVLRRVPRQVLTSPASLRCVTAGVTGKHSYWSCSVPSLTSQCVDFSNFPVNTNVSIPITVTGVRPKTAAVSRFHNLTFEKLTDNATIRSATQRVAVSLIPKPVSGTHFPCVIARTPTDFTVQFNDETRTISHVDPPHRLGRGRGSANCARSTHLIRDKHDHCKETVR